MKKILALFLCAAMVFSVSSLSVFAEETVGELVGVNTEDGSLNSNQFSLTELSGLAGKASDDAATAFVLDESGASSEIKWSYALSEIVPDKVGTSGASKGIYFAFNLYASGDAVARISYSSGYKILEWGSDGTATATGASDPITMERGKWHKIVLSMNDSNGGRIALFVDGVRIAASADSTWNSISGKSPLSIGVVENSKNGIVAFDDIYYSYWEAPNTYNSIKGQDLPAITNTENVTYESETNTFVYAEDVFADVEGLGAELQSVFSNAEEIGIFNKDLSAPATDLADAKIVAIKLNSNAYCYFNIKMQEFIPDHVEIIGDETCSGVASIFSNPTSKDKSVVIILVLKDENGVIQKLAASPETVVEAGAEDVEIVIEPIESEGLKAEAFFIESWSTRLRLFDEIYKN